MSEKEAEVSSDNANAEKETPKGNYHAAHWARMVYWAAERRFGAGDEILMLAGLEKRQVVHARRIEFKNFAAVLLAAMDKYGDEVIVEIGRTSCANALGITGLVLQAAPNLKTLFTGLRDAKKVIAPQAVIDIRRTPSEFVFEAKFPFLSGPISRMWLYVVTSVIDDLVLRHPGSDQVTYEMTHGPETNDVDKNMWIGRHCIVPSLFDGTVGIRVSFPVGVAYLQNIYFPKPTSYAEMKRLAIDFRAVATEQTTKMSLVDAIANMFLIQRVVLDKTQVSDALAMTHRTLDRNLALEDSNWRSAKAESIGRLLGALALDGVSEDRLWRQLGFSSPAALEKALSYRH